MDDTTAHAIANNLAVQNAVQQVVADGRHNRPKNTSKNYDNKQLEWIRWCAERAFVDGSLVTEGKLLLYLKEVVVPQGSRKAVNGEVRALSADGLEGYVKAIVDLFSTQQSLGLNRDPHPRGNALKIYLKTQKRQRSKRKRTEYHDRGEGTVQDTYTAEELKRVAISFMECRNGRALRNRLDLLLGHALMARGGNTRKLQLPDLFAMEIQNEGPTPCWVAVAILDQGKVNQYGRIEYGGCTRARDVEICPVGAIALYFFWRFQISGEPFPDMSARQNWYDCHVVNGKDSHKEISYGAQASGLKKAMMACGIVSKKVTHIRRTSSCVIAEANGASDASIRRGGRWTNEKMEGCYLTTLPKEVIRALAGFNPAGGGYYLPRAEYPVPESILADVFPQLESAQRLFDQGAVHDIAGQGFLRLVRWLRTVLIQDSVLLRRAYSDHPIWQDPVFSTSAYAEYARRVESTLQESSCDSVEKTIQAALPLLAEVVQSGLASVGTRLSAIENTMSLVKGELQKVANESTTVPATPPPVGTRLSSPLTEAYRLSRNLRTVDDVWMEYVTGVSGGPAIRTLEATCGAKWRKDECERKYFSRRKVYYDAIQFLASRDRVSPATIATLLEQIRVRRNITLDAMMKDLKQRGPSVVFDASTI